MFDRRQDASEQTLAELRCICLRDLRELGGKLEQYEA